MDTKPDCLKQNMESVTTTHGNVALSKTLDIKMQLYTDRGILSQKSANKSELRLKWLHQKVEKISQKVRRSQTVKQIEQEEVSTTHPNYNVHIFYYAWYGNVAVDGHWRHWNHKYLPNWKKEDKIYPTGTHEPPGDVSSNFYPMLGCYSSKDPVVIDTHMKQLSDAKVGVVVVSWYPPGTSDPQGDSPDLILPLLLDSAQRHDIRVALHIEPYRDRNPINLSQYIRYIIGHYGGHPAFYRMQRRGRSLPVFYVYDSYLTPAGAWKELLSAKGNLSVRGTQLDGIFLGLLVDMQHRYDIKKSHFDGFYTYFATNGFTYGSSWKNWRSLSKFARQNYLLFVPSVGPGYIDTQIRPWNMVNTRHRRHGKYYEVGWRSALSAQAKLISITSFNEWHEGTQIEPAVQKATASFTYFDYEPEGPNFYLNLTKWWVKEFSKKQEGE
ncbi:glycoprotein endo-alpha-1,2-mannosidase isoform X2 [Zootermopsis nevadensis]|nr:glycoprotein endo-alpha-1,2-mannosidase isoform X2 [Zootermopsis nevadensis]